MTFIINNQELTMELTHDDRRDRRRKIALACKGGADRHAVGRRFGVSDRLVRMACDEHGVEYQRERGVRPPGIVAIVAGLIKARHHKMARVAETTGNSKQRVYQVLQECIRYGLVKASKFGRSS